MMDFLSLYQRSFLAGLLTAVATSLMGVHVVFRRMAFFGDAIAHVAFAAAAIGVTIGVSSFVSAVVLSMIVSLVLAKLSRRNVSEDVAVGVLFSLTMAVGVVLFSLTKRQRSLMSYLFGDILTITNVDMIYLSIITILVIVYNTLFKDALVQFTFDEDFARLMRPKIELIYQLFLMLLAATVVIGVRTVGVILVSAFLIIPAATASIVARDYRWVFLFALILSPISVVAGLLLSLNINAPPGALIVLLQGVAFFMVAVLRR